jgi:small subunit ribosomal protein S27e
MQNMQEGIRTKGRPQSKEGGVRMTGFIKVHCECKNEQVVFAKASSPVNCLVCGKQLAKPTGGKAQILGQQVEVLQ